MKITKLSLLGSLASLLLTGAISARPLAPADTTLIYLNENRQPVPSAAGATYLVKRVPSAGGAGVEYSYTLDGWLAGRSEYADLRKRMQQGLNEEYYPHSRQVKVVSHFQQNALSGELLSYYPGGQLKRREQYLQTVSQGGQCFDEAGQPIAFVPYLVLAEFPGGLPALAQYVGQQVRYPKAERRAGHEGQVLVDFVVDAQGQVQDARVREPLYPALDAEALRVVNAMPRWQPARVEGQPDKINFTLPVRFRLQ